MPLRITVELIPRGLESEKNKICVLDVSNDGTGTDELGNYKIEAHGITLGGGWDLWSGFPKRIEKVDRLSGYERIAARAMQVLLEEDKKDKL